MDEWVGVKPDLRDCLAKYKNKKELSNTIKMYINFE
jgi:hypothetical protein